MAAGLGLPLGDGLQPEPREMERSRVFGADQVDGIGLVFQLIKTHADVLAVKWAQRGVVFVVELLCNEDALVACEGNRFGEGALGVVHIVDGPPRAIHPVGAGFEDVVLEIVLAE